MSTTETLTLAEFLLARIAEDEAVAKAIAAPPSTPWETISKSYPMSPYRVLVECEARRRIVEEHQRAEDALSNRRTESLRNRRRIRDEALDGQVAAYRRVVAQLALPHADHPDYREEWRP